MRIWGATLAKRNKCSNLRLYMWSLDFEPSLLSGSVLPVHLQLSGFINFIPFGNVISESVYMCC